MTIRFFGLSDYVTPDFEFTSPMKEVLNFFQYSHYVAYLSNSMRFEAVKITSEYDQIFNVEMILDIVDVQVGFTAKISALSEVRLKDELVTHLYVRYSGTVAEMDYMNACAAGFKQSLLDKE